MFLEIKVITKNKKNENKIETFMLLFLYAIEHVQYDPLVHTTYLRAFLKVCMIESTE